MSIGDIGGLCDNVRLRNKINFDKLDKRYYFKIQSINRILSKIS